MISFLKSFFSKIKSLFASSHQSLKPSPTINKPQELWGVDLSHHDGEVDFQSLKESGASFVFIKATEGTSFIDPMFKQNIAKAKEAGLLCGAYHFFRKNSSVLIQAQCFYNTATSTGFIPTPVLDWESSYGSVGRLDIEDARYFLIEIEKLTGKIPIIYTGASFGAEMKLPREFSRYPLWIAHYGVKTPKVPPPWSDYTFWQYTETGSVPGVPTKCDVNYFNGDMVYLKSLLG